MKVGLKKLLIWALVVSSLLGVVAGSQVTAIKTSDALEKMKEAGKIQLVTNVMSKCVKQRVDKPYNPDKGGISENYVPYAPTTDTFADLTTSIPSGSWLENQIQGKVNNGTIDCQDNDSNIINVFASTLGVDKNAVFCDGKNPGILKLQNQDSSGKWVDVSGECAAGIGNNNLRFVFNDEGANAHIKKLYNAQKGKNQYLVSWGDRGTFSDDLINYFLYFNDFTTSCSSSSPYSGDESLLNKSKYFGPIKVPNPSTGKMEERYYSNTSVVKNSWGSNWVDKKGAHTCDDVIKRINETAPAVQKALNATEKDEDGTKPDDIVGDITDDAVENNGEEASPCSQAASSLGWIICPVVQVLSKAVDGIYGYIENNYLQLNNSYVSSDSGTRSGWETFRNIANVVFVITLLIIILSQITGFGVSNYGIKKMLPSLIIVAVLVNVSFFLCEVAVDLSNIVGYGIKELFENLGVNPERIGDVGIGPLLASVIPTLLSGGAMFAGIAIAAATWELWIMPFLLLLLVTVIGILFFFILLGARQAGIIILVALSPVAIVCYALPNTKSIFSRWWKMFSALLLVYPICGALMGGGQFASKLLLSNIGDGAGEGGTLFYTFVAILIQVVPFFFIPSILRSSFQALGNIGNKLSTFGTRLGRSATGAIRRSEGYKDTQSRLAGRNARRAIRRSESTSGILGVRNKLGERMRNGNNRVSRAMKESYNRRQARYVNTAAGQRIASQNAAFIAGKGMDAAERRMNASMVKNYEEEYGSNLSFMNDSRTQEEEYSKAIDSVVADPTNQDSIARLRALQNVLSKTDPGRSIIENSVNKRLYDEQEAARAAGRTAVVSDGLRTVGQTLMNDHAAFKGTSRGFYSTVNAVNSANDPQKVFGKGKFAADEIKDSRGRVIGHNYHNSSYDAQAAGSSAADLGGADERTLRNLASSVAGMNQEQLASVYRSTSEAITNDNISVKPENEGLLNNIRQAAYNKMQADAAGSTDYYDDQGRTFVNTGGNNYDYSDASGTVRNFTRDATTGNFTEVGGSGEVISSGNMMSASENFNSNYGSSYRDLHASDEFKVSHTPARRKIDMPPGWVRNSDGTWINSREGFRKLTPDEVRRAEQYEAHNIQVDIDNDTRR